MKFFLACVPFGCDNIGDEAILECIVKILRRDFDNPDITAATRKPAETSKLLGVRAVPLYGFDAPADSTEVLDAIKVNDVFIWAGATGLSDYPDTALPLLRAAQAAGLKTIVWGVGMDGVLNPAFFKLGGKKLKLCRLLNKLFLGGFDFVAMLENRMERRVRGRIGDALSKCTAVVVRDPQTADELAKCPQKLNVFVGADSAIALDVPDLQRLECVNPPLREKLLSDAVKIGVCISSQRRVENLDGLAECFDRLLEDHRRLMFFIPMNPLTDSKLMEKISARMKNRGRAFMLENCIQPQEVQAAAACCDVVISSRLHLLILSANASTPIVGIARGSKLDNFLKPFGLKCACGVSDFSVDAVCAKTEEAIAAGKESFGKTRAAVYADLNHRLSRAEFILQESLKQ